MTSTTTASIPKPSVNRKQLPPGPSEWPLVGQSFQFLNDPVKLMQETSAYGDLATLSVKPMLMYQLNHPKLIHEVFVTQDRRVGRGHYTEALKYLMGEGLVTSDDPLHLRQRRLMQPQFHRRRIAGYGEIMVDYAQRHAQNWVDGAKVDMTEEMSNLALHIVVKTLFGLDLPEDVQRIGEAFDISNNYIIARERQPDWMRRMCHVLPFPLTRRFKQGLAFLDQTVYGLIAQRRQAGIDSHDLLSLLLQARDEDSSDPDGGSMTDQQVRDETITLFAAGHETTAVALTWAWYLLATHPEWQERFHAEVDEVLGTRPATMEDLPHLPLTEQIVTEAMRLYPPIWTTGRMVFQPFELSGYQIPAGATLVATQLLVHRDPRWFDKPLEFHPDRWTPEFRRQLPKFAYFPFGGGSRVCIGEGFAWMEAKLVLATLGQHWRMRHDSQHTVEMHPLVSLRPKGGMPIFLERRR